MIRCVQGYKITCNRCDVDFMDEQELGTLLFHTMEELCERIRDEATHGWHIDGEEALCPDCREEQKDD